MLSRIGLPDLGTVQLICYNPLPANRKGFQFAAGNPTAYLAKQSKVELANCVWSLMPRLSLAAN